ncbi:hypothetical protein N656DRAFT_719960 [Canariomyces notabilis]|uniref:Zn(2)-C6 fungal-type domain-containing protein n=1 Tax=Canariomyces notabilis TaxID=2074819 RepID=A0AAN6QC46_9PEZI|nr:hypothetical protein N656DRAFT_719960 [Canariomyces arenarius]
MPRQHLTPNACLVCRKKRTKCDGQLPCRRCRSRGEECAYEDKKWRTKDHLRSEIERLRAEQRQGHALIRALTNNDPERWETVMGRLRAGEPPDTIAEWIHSENCLSGKQSHPVRPSAESPFRDDISRYLSSPFRPTGTLGMETMSAERIERIEIARLGTAKDQGHGYAMCSIRVGHVKSSSASPMRLSPFRGSLPSQPSHQSFLLPDRDGHLHAPPPETRADGPILRTWTKVTHDTRLVQQLLDLFFSNSLPHLSLVSQPQFMRDFKEGTPRYCSEALVNAMLGMACRLTSQTTQPIPHISSREALFITEAKALLATEETHVNLPSIQALGVLALAEMSRGNEDEAGDLARESVRQCIRFVLETQRLDSLQDEDFRAVRAAAYCGGFSLIRALRLLTGDLEPKTGPLFMRLHPDSRDQGEDSPESRVERGIALQMQFFTELPHCPSLVRFVFEVTEAAHTFSSYNYSRAMTAADLDGALSKCVSCHGRFVESFAFDTDGGPDVFFAQIWYHFCLLSLLQPFASSSASLVDGLPTSLIGDASSPKAVCQRASEAIIILADTYQSRYSPACLPPLLPYMVFAAVLYQLSLDMEQPLVSNEEDRHVKADSPPDVKLSPPDVKLSPQITHSSVRSDLKPGMAAASLPLSTDAVSQDGLPEPVSPLLSTCMQRHTSTSASTRVERRPSAASSACFSADAEPSRRSSVCSFITANSLSTTISEEGDDSPDAAAAATWSSSGLLMPTFGASRPADLVTVGSLQLESMGAQHAGAAHAARWLRAATVWAQPELASTGLGLGQLDQAPSDSFVVTPLEVGGFTGLNTPAPALHAG